MLGTMSGSNGRSLSKYASCQRTSNFTDMKGCCRVIMGGGERDERLLGQLTSLNSRLAQASSAKGAMSR